MAKLPLIGARPAARAAAHFASRSDEELSAFARQEMFPEGMHKYAGNINLERLDEFNDVKALVEDVVQANPGLVEESRRGTIRREQLTMLANEVGLTEDELLARPIGEAWNAERITAARGLLANARSEVSELAARIRARQATPGDMVQFRRKLSRYAAMQHQMHGAAAEAGRALGAFNVHIKSGMFQAQELDELLEAGGGAGTIEKMAEHWERLSAESPAAAAKYARRAHRATNPSMLVELFINSILSSPGTHAVNVTTNSAFGLTLPFERMLAGLVPGGDITPREGLAMLQSIPQGIADGMRLARKALVSGTPSDEASKLDALKHRAITPEVARARIERGLDLVGIDPKHVRSGGPAAQAVDLIAGAFHIGEVLRGPSRALLTEDEFFKGVLYRMEVAAQAHRLARREGETRSAADIQSRILAERDANMDAMKTANALVDEGLDSVHMEAIDFARYGTFQSRLGNVGSPMVTALNRVPLSRLFIPFIQAPVNLTKAAAERSPFAVVMPKFYAALEAGGAQRQLAIQKVTTGSLLTGSLAVFIGANDDGNYCLDSDLCITGGPPPDADLERSLADAGWKPYAVKIDGVYHQYNRMDPLGWMMGVTADMLALSHSEDFVELTGNLAIAVSENLVNKQWMSGMSDLLEALRLRDKRAMQRYIARQSAAFTPYSSLQNFMKRHVLPEEAEGFLQGDRVRRRAESYIDQIRARTIGGTPDLPPLQDFWGDPKPANRGWMIYEGHEREGDKGLVNAEMIRLGMHPGLNDPTWNGMKLEPWEAHDFYQLRGSIRFPDVGAVIEGVELAGKTMAEAMAEVMRTPAYRDHMVDDVGRIKGSRRLVLQDVIDAYHKVAMRHPELGLTAKHPHLRPVLEAFSRQRALLGSQGREGGEAVREALQ